MKKINKSKIIWLINQYGSLPKTGIGGRHRHFARELAMMGHKVSYIASRVSHNTFNKASAMSAPEIEEFEGFHFLRISSVNYKYANDKKRILNWFYFAFKLLGVGKKLEDNPDVIIYSSPSLIGFVSAYILAKKYNAKLIFDVRDIWPLTFTEIGGYSKKNPFIMLLQFIEDFAYKKTDHIISNLKGLNNHLKTRIKNKKNFTWIPNGFSFTDTENKSADKRILSLIKKQRFSITYTGTINLAKSLDTLVDAADLIKSKKYIYINIVGHGSLLNKLKTKVKKLKLNNVHFFEAVTKNQVQSILKVSDACIKCTKNSDLYKYGTAANKLYEYLYSERPIIHAYSGNFDPVKEFKAGITVPAENPLLLSRAIINLSLMSVKKRKKMGKNGKQAVKKYFDYSKISHKLNSIIYS